MTRSVFIIIFSLLPLLAQSQITISGTVYNQENAVQPEVSVYLQNPATKSILDYRFTDAAGKFSFVYSGGLDSLMVSVSGFNIPIQEKHIKAIRQRLDFIVDYKPLEIGAAIVRSKSIYGTNDTINYSVGAFLTDQDVVIEDVIKKLPGVDVSSSGAISYQGKNINKFYVEDMDLLGGRYTLATRNISARDISNVQILENHQPVRALTGIKYSDQAAMNLKLREEVKGTFSITAQLGLGANTTLLWNNSLAAMFFGHKRQNMTIYKGNNSGYDMTSELRSHTARDYFGNQNMLQVRMPSPPSIDLKRYLFNNSNAFTFNELRKAEDNSETKINLVYLNDHINRHGYSRTSYYIPGEETRILEEDIASAMNIDRLEFDLNYNINDSRKFLNNLLKFEGIRQGTFGNLVTDMPITQRTRLPEFSVTDHFNIVRTNTDKKGYTLAASAGFKNSPQTLVIDQGLYPDLFNNGEEYYGLLQNLDMRKVYANANGSLLSLFSMGMIHFDAILSIDAQYSDLESDIFMRNGQGEYYNSTDNEMSNYVQWSKLSAILGTAFRYDHGNLQMTLSVPVTYSYFGIKDRKRSSDRNLSKVFLQPNFTANYTISSKIKMSANYAFNNTVGDIQSIYTGYILQNYHSLNRFDGQLPESTLNGGSFSLEYKDIIKMLFANVSANYSNTKNNMLTDQTFEDILILTSRLPISNRSERYGTSVNFNKGFDLWSLNFKLGGTYSQGSSESLRQENLMNYYNNIVTLTGSVSMKPVRFITLSYDGKWGRSYSRIYTGNKFDPIRSFVNNASISIHPVNGLSINGHYEHYYNSAGLNNKYFSFTDLGISYRVKNVDMNLEWQNIFDTNSHMTTYYGDVNMYQSVYNIRPASILFTVKFRLF